MSFLLHYQRMHADFKSAILPPRSFGKAFVFSCIVCSSFLRLISQGDGDKFSLPSPKVHLGQFPIGLKLYPMLGRAYENRPHPMDMSPIRLKVEAFQILID